MTSLARSRSRNRAPATIQAVTDARAFRGVAAGAIT
jgi:hypothetical protein